MDENECRDLRVGGGICDSSCDGSNYIESVIEGAEISEDDVAGSLAEEVLDNRVSLFQ